MGPIQTTLMVWWIFLYSRHNVYNTLGISGSYISSYDALLGHHEDEADEDGRAQHADGTHERVGPFRLLAAQPCGGGPDDHAQQSGHTGDRPEDYARTGERVKREYLTCFKLMQAHAKIETHLYPFICAQKDAHFFFFLSASLCLVLNSPVCATADLFCAGFRCLLHHLSSGQVQRNPHAKGTRGERHRCGRQRGEHVAPASRAETEKKFNR